MKITFFVLLLSLISCGRKNSFVGPQKETKESKPLTFDEHLEGLTDIDGSNGLYVQTRSLKTFYISSPIFTHASIDMLSAPETLKCDGNPYSLLAPVSPLLKESLCMSGRSNDRAYFDLDVKKSLDSFLTYDNGLGNDFNIHILDIVSEEKESKDVKIYVKDFNVAQFVNSQSITNNSSYSIEGGFISQGIAGYQNSCQGNYVCVFNLNNANYRFAPVELNASFLMW